MELVLGFKEIVEKACRGERRAFSALHERYAPMVHAVLLARVPAREADDLVQDVFLRALEKIHTACLVGSSVPDPLSAVLEPKIGAGQSAVVTLRATCFIQFWWAWGVKPGDVDLAAGEVR